MSTQELYKTDINQSICITGGAGYIGSHTAWQLLDNGGKQPVIIDNLRTGHKALIPKESPFYQLNCGDSAQVAGILKRHNVTTVIHLAASLLVYESTEKPLEYYQNNVEQTIGLLKACQIAGVKNIVFSSTAAVYGETSDKPIDESVPCKPINPYGRTKLACEWLIQDLVQANQLNGFIFRYFNVAGADINGRSGESPPVSSHLIKRLCEAASGYRPLDRLTIFGEDYDTPDGTCIRDYLHVTDVADAHIKAVDYLQDKNKNTVGTLLTCNLGTGQGFSVKQVIAAAEQELGQPINTEPGNRRVGDSAISIANPSLANKTLNWQAKYSTLSNMINTGLRWETLAKEKLRG